MPDPIDFVVIPFLLAAGVALAVLLLAWLPGVGTRGGGRWVGPLALAAGTLAPFSQITGAIPSFPPAAAMGWLFYLTILAALVAVVLTLLRPRRWVGAVAAVVLFFVSFTIVFKNQLPDPENMATVVKLVAAASLVGGAWWWIMESAASELERVTAPLAMLVLAISGAAMLMMTASATYGRLGLAFAGAVLPLVLLSPLRRESFAQGCGIVLVVALGGVILAGNYYSVSELRWVNLVLVGIAPLLMAVRGMIPAMNRNGKAGIVVSLSLLVISLIVASIVTVPHFVQESKADVSGYDY